jgi:hypothetical protein
MDGSAALEVEDDSGAIREADHVPLEAKLLASRAERRSRCVRVEELRRGEQRGSGAEVDILLARRESRYRRRVRFHTGVRVTDRANSLPSGVSERIHPRTGVTVPLTCCTNGVRLGRTERILAGMGVTAPFMGCANSFRLGRSERIHAEM